MDLDKRIKNNHRPLCVIDIKWAMGFIGKNGFFADAINCFENLSECASGKLVSVEDKKIHPFECDNEWNYMFFIPEEWVVESKEQYRAYTLKEFLEAMESGLFESWIKMRHNRSKRECEFLYTGYWRTIDNDYICLGCHSFDFETLLNDYEIPDLNGKWHPFGVLVLDEKKK